jgi:hypothetical protein
LFAADGKIKGTNKNKMYSRSICCIKFNSHAPVILLEKEIFNMPEIAEPKNFGVWVETCGETYLIGNGVVGESIFYHEFF